MWIRKTGSARKHRVGTDRLVQAMLNATSVRTYATSKGEAIEWIGPDDLWIIHAQPTTYTKGAQS